MRSCVFIRFLYVHVDEIIYLFCAIFNGNLPNQFVDTITSLYDLDYLHSKYTYQHVKEGLVFIIE